MESTVDKDCSAYGGLFLTIISDLKSSSPVWEDFIAKASKLHTSLKSTLIAIAAFLDAFQKVADMATGSRGGTKEIGTSLTRLCMRHKAIESKLKKFTGTILDHLVTPLQDCMEDWKKTAVQLDKDHAKDYKRAKQDIKKSAADTVRLQKKAKKASANGTASLSPLWFDEGKHDIQNRLDNALHEVNEKYVQLEEQEKNAVRLALIEERSRYCHFVTNLKPFVDEELSLLTEVTHLQEIMDILCVQADGSKLLPQSSEQVIIDLKGTEASSSLKFQTPPSSPSSIGSRKSSMCSINSIASSSSGSAQSHSPCHASIQQQQAQLLGLGVRLTSISSQDSGFTSQDTLFLRPTTPSSLNLQTQTTESTSQDVDTPEVDSNPTTPSEIYSNTISATWTNWQNPPDGLGKAELGRPHTISSAYEKSHHSRPALSSQLFEPPPQEILEEPKSEQDAAVVKRDRPQSTIVTYSRPSASINKMQPVLPPLGPKPKPKAIAPPKVPAIDGQPLYANLHEISTQVQITDVDTPVHITDVDAQVQITDGDKTPTTTPPAVNEFEPLFVDGLDLTDAIRDLDNCTAALHGDFSPGDRKSKRQKNSIELAAAIKELEASTAALQSSYDNGTQASQSSLHSSSSYGTMNSMPASSEDPIASGENYHSEMDRQSNCGTKQHEKYFTIPRDNPISVVNRAAVFKRLASTTGIPMPGQGGDNGGSQLMRRSSLNHPKPPPPVRRTPSIIQTGVAVLQKYRTSPRQLNAQGGDPHMQDDVLQQSQPSHRRSLSAATGNDHAHTYAELSEIHRSITLNNLQQQTNEYHQSQDCQVGNPLHGANILSATVTPQCGQPVTALSHMVLNSDVIDGLNTKLSTINSQSTQLSQTWSEHNLSSYSSNCPDRVLNAIETNCSVESDFPDLPPPPSEDELKEMEHVYNMPKQNVSPQMLAYNVMTSNSVQMRHQPVQNFNTVVPGVDMKQSLISEMKAGNKFRKVSSDGDLES